MTVDFKYNLNNVIGRTVKIQKNDAEAEVKTKIPNMTRATHGKVEINEESESNFYKHKFEEDISLQKK